MISVNDISKDRQIAARHGAAFGHRKKLGTYRALYNYTKASIV